MKSKAIILTIFLSIGFTFQNCNTCRCPDFSGDFFDIQDMRIVQFKKGSGVNSIIALEENEQIQPDQYHGFAMRFLVDYISEESPFRILTSDISLIPAAMACDCAVNGLLGSKEEKLQSLEIQTIFNFDATHPKNSTLNDLLTVSVFRENMPLDSFLARDTALIDYEDLYFFLESFPTLNDTFQVKIRLALSTGEMYEESTPPIIFIP
jgi:hypothetical protein